MTFPVIVLSQEGRFTASLVGAPEVRVVGASRDKVIEAIRAKLAEYLDRGELVAVEVFPMGITSLAGKYADDPTLQEICDEAYRQRDAEILP